MINKIFIAISYATLLMAMVLLLNIGYWYFHEYNAIEFKNNPHQVENPDKTVKSGDYLVYRVDYCKHLDIIPQISKSFIDGVVYTIPEMVGANFPVGCGVNHVQVYIPKALPPGVYHLRIVFKYQVNPIKVKTYTLQTENFTVIK